MQKKLLYEVSVMRPLAIVLIVAMHACTSFAGNWEPIPNVDMNIPAYSYIVDFIMGFALEAFALVSGYVYAFQSVELGHRYEFKSFVWKKFMRLLLPCYFFGLIYYMLFKFKVHTFSVSSMILSVLNRMGHLWFIPMLFWCFLVMWWIEKKHLKERLVFVALFGLSVLPMPTLPLGLGIVPHYLFYFYGGYLLYKYKHAVLSRLAKWRNIVLLVLIYVVFLQIRIYVTNWYSNVWLECGWVLKVSILIACNILRSIVSGSGILALYLAICRKTERLDYTPKNWLLWLSSICFGVYVYHQFVLLYLYYKSSFPTYVSNYVLPWVGLAITLIVSVLLTLLTLKTKCGKFLIG